MVRIHGPSAQTVSFAGWGLMNSLSRLCWSTTTFTWPEIYKEFSNSVVCHGTKWTCQREAFDGQSVKQRGEK